MRLGDLYFGPDRGRGTPKIMATFSDLLPQEVDSCSVGVMLALSAWALGVWGSYPVRMWQYPWNVRGVAVRAQMVSYYAG